MNTTSDTTTQTQTSGGTNECIDIQVEPHFLADHSDPEAQRYVFAYTVEITNRGNESVKLLNRRWQITDDNNKVEEVIGEGVVGQQPEIAPGTSFNYTSGAVIETEFGTMEGSYELEDSQGQRFSAAIPPFLLARPFSVH